MRTNWLRKSLSFNFARRPASHPPRWLARVAVYTHIGRWQFSWTVDRGSRYPEDYEPYVLRSRWRLTPRVHAMLLRFYERPAPTGEKIIKSEMSLSERLTGLTNLES